MNYPRLLIAGTHSGVGKTTVSLALMSAFRARGRRVQPFKAGPDFIDPGHHRLACERHSRNLDSWMLGKDLNRQIFVKTIQGSDLAIVEGMMGLFDGASATDEKGSVAELAKLLDLPVLLVIDGSAMARSAAAMVFGYSKFDPALKVVGVLFNRVRTDSHYHLLREAVESTVNVPVVGYLQPNEDIAIPDRHLGLRTAIEQGNADFYHTLGLAIKDTVDLDLIEHLAQGCIGMDVKTDSVLSSFEGFEGTRVRIGVAYDPAFCFYYQDNLEMLQACGGEVVLFSPIRDSTLPDVDMVYVGGGYPELYGEALQENVGMRHAIREFGERGGVIFGECGGLMFLTESIKDFEGRTYEMVGMFPGEVTMNRRLRTLGYREVEVLESSLLGEEGTKVRGHEFHYSSYSRPDSVHYVCGLRDSKFQNRGSDGLQKNNVLAMYTHLHFASQPSIPKALVGAARKYKAKRDSLANRTPYV